MTDIELLAIAVEKYPCLWNVSDEDYHNRDLKELAWESIGKEIFTDWEDIDEKEKKTRCADIKKKWANVRDSYRKDMQRSKNLPSGYSTKKLRRYIYADILSYLQPVYDSKNSDRNCTSFDEIQRNTNVEEEIESSNFEQSPSESREKISKSERIKKKKKHISNQIFEIQQQNQNTRRQRDDADDDDTNFLLSFRTDMKRMNTSDKIDFKIGMLKLVKSILQPSPSRSNCYCTPHLQTLYIKNPIPASSHYSSTPPVYIQTPNIPNPIPPLAHCSCIPPVCTQAPNSQNPISPAIDYSSKRVRR